MNAGGDTYENKVGSTKPRCDTCGAQLAVYTADQGHVFCDEDCKSFYFAFHDEGDKNKEEEQLEFKRFMVGNE